MCNDFETMDPYFDDYGLGCIYPQPNPEAYEDWGLSEEDHKKLIEQNLDNVARRVEVGDVIGKSAVGMSVVSFF